MKSVYVVIDLEVDIFGAPDLNQVHIFKSSKLAKRYARKLMKGRNPLINDPVFQMESDQDYFMFDRHAYSGPAYKYIDSVYINKVKPIN